MSFCIDREADLPYSDRAINMVEEEYRRHEIKASEGRCTETFAGGDYGVNEALWPCQKGRGSNNEVS